MVIRSCVLLLRIIILEVFSSFCPVNLDFLVVFLWFKKDTFILMWHCFLMCKSVVYSQCERGLPGQSGGKKKVVTFFSSMKMLNNTLFNAWMVYFSYFVWILWFSTNEAFIISYKMHCVLISASFIQPPFLFLLRNNLWL